MTHTKALKSYPKKNIQKQ